MPITAWSFLVSRNRYLDYRTIVAPDFICQAKISNLLARAVEGELTKPNEIIVRQVVNSKVNDLTMIFQVVTAKEKDINSEGNNMKLRDQFGREIYLFEGVIVKGIGEDYIYVDNNDLKKAHQQLIVIYQQFWNSLEPYPAISSSRFSIEVIGADRCLNRKMKPRYNVSIHQ